MHFTSLHFTASKRATQKATKTTGDSIGNKIADKITKVSRSLPQNSSETVECQTENTGFDEMKKKKKETQKK